MLPRTSVHDERCAPGVSLAKSACPRLFCNGLKDVLAWPVLPFYLSGSNSLNYVRRALFNCQAVAMTFKHFRM